MCQLSCLDLGTGSFTRTGGMITVLCFSYLKDVERVHVHICVLFISNCLLHKKLSLKCGGILLLQTYVDLFTTILACTLMSITKEKQR